MKIPKKIKRLWDLSKKDQKILEALTEEQLKILPNASEEGDGKAVFFGEGTPEEFEEMQKEDNGLSKAYKMLKNLV